MIEITHMPLESSTYLDPKGVLRSNIDDSCVVWHYKVCYKTGIHASEIVYDPQTNAPWCPSCWENKRVFNLFNRRTK